jgi:hypothetical protein
MSKASEIRATEIAFKRTWTSSLTVAAVKGDPAALKALRKLQKQGADPVILLLYLDTVWLLVQPANRKKLRDWAGPTGKTRKALKNLPLRLRKSAQEIRSVWRHDHFNPWRLVPQRKSIAEYLEFWKSKDSEFWKSDVGKRFNSILNLPEQLDFYGDLLEVQIRMQEQSSSHSQRDPLRSSKLNLIHYVTRSTGKANDAAIAVLLSAVIRAASRRADAEVTPRSISMLRSRSKNTTQSGPKFSR